MVYYSPHQGINRASPVRGCSSRPRPAPQPCRRPKEELGTRLTVKPPGGRRAAGAVPRSHGIGCRAGRSPTKREGGAVPPRILRMCALAVSCSASCPAPVGMRRSAPASSSSATTGAWLRLQAQCRQVLRREAAPSEPAGRSAHGAGSRHGKVLQLRSYGSMNPWSRDALRAALCTSAVL